MEQASDNKWMSHLAEHIRAPRGKSGVSSPWFAR